MKVGVSRTSTLIPSEKGLVLIMLDFKSLHYQLNSLSLNLIVSEVSVFWWGVVGGHLLTFLAYRVGSCPRLGA